MSQMRLSVIIGFIVSLTVTAQRQFVFTENKGQVSDQYFKPRTDVLYSTSLEGLTYHFSTNGFSVQQFSVTAWTSHQEREARPLDIHADSVPISFAFYRVDMSWLNCNSNVITKGSHELEGYANYYLQACPNGVFGVKSYSELIYQNLYNGIDVRWHFVAGKLKYDYLISPGSDYTRIKIEYKGADKLFIENENLVVVTPLGSFIEEAPVAIQEGRSLKACWKVKGKIVSYEISGIDKSKPFIIDPLIRPWGTYYGGLLNENAYCVTTDIFNNSFLSGDTQSNTTLNIATVGAHQTTFGGTGTGMFPGDAFLVKFNSAGVRQWATYYGGSGSEFGRSCAADNMGNVYMCGASTSTAITVIATPGSHQQTINGGGQYGDAFLIKFDAAGVRQWGTYYGGSNDDAAFGISVANGSVAMCGFSASNANIASFGSFQNTLNGIADCFISVFDSNGSRLWGTYYGGSGGNDCANDCEFDAAGNLFVGGGTNSSANISSVGAHQTVYGGGLFDGFLAKFDMGGQRIWGTFYGGNQRDIVYAISVKPDTIYFVGETQSVNSIATPNVHQPTIGGGYDAFIGKVSANGVRYWATYYGGPGNDSSDGVCTDSQGNIYFTGITSTASGTYIATPCTYQEIFGGGPSDLYFAKLSGAGQRAFGSYYGGSGFEYWSTCALDQSNSFFIGGRTATASGTSIASANAHQPSHGGGNHDGFLAKFLSCTPAVLPNTTSPPQMTVCAGQSTSLSTTLTSCGINWKDAPNGNVIGTSSVLVTPTLAANTTYYVQDISCGPGGSLTAIEVTVHPLPLLVLGSSDSIVCAGTQVTLSAAGAFNYTWLPTQQLTGTININPTSTMQYSVTGGNSLCTNSAVITVSTVATPSLQLQYFQNPQCYGSTVAVNAAGAQSYSWQPLNLIANGTSNSFTTVSLVQPESFTVAGYNSLAAVTCSSQSVFTISVLEQLIATVSPSVEICEGGKTVLYVNGGNNWYWTGENIEDPYTQGVLVAPTQSGIYSVNASYNSVCPVTATVFVKVNPKPYLFAGNDTTINIGDPVFIAAASSGTVHWINGDNVACAECAVTNVFPFTKTCYLAETVDSKGCRAQDEICIEVINDFGIYIPNTFTPNNDGVNEMFTIYGFGIKDFSLKIYNRWGELLYEGNGEGWNGTYKGSICEQGTYIYKAEITPYKGKFQQRAGHVNLLRGQ